MRLESLAPGVKFLSNGEGRLGEVPPLILQLNARALPAVAMTRRRSRRSRSGERDAVSASRVESSREAKRSELINRIEGRKTRGGESLGREREERGERERSPRASTDAPEDFELLVAAHDLPGPGPVLPHPLHERPLFLLVPVSPDDPILVHFALALALRLRGLVRVARRVRVDRARDRRRRGVVRGRNRGRGVRERFARVVGEVARDGRGGCVFGGRVGEGTAIRAGDGVGRLRGGRRRLRTFTETRRRALMSGMRRCDSTRGSGAARRGDGAAGTRASGRARERDFRGFAEYRLSGRTIDYDRENTRRTSANGTART